MLRLSKYVSKPAHTGITKLVVGRKVEYVIAGWFKGESIDVRIRNYK